MMPPSMARRRALRAVLSALAGGGLTAAALGGPLAGGALAASPVAGEEAAGTSTGGGAAETAAGPTTSTGTSTTPPTPTTPSTTTGTTTAPPAATPAPSTQEAPAVVLQRRQKTTVGKASPSVTSTKAQKEAKNGSAKNNVAGSPQNVAEAGALAAVLASSQASVQALSFYRVPLFLLPIYKAAAVQYGVPWQILAAINEIETNYGTDQSVSSAGAIGWMQFEPATWLQYGVDALNAGYADPYNPVDAIFAAARYLRAAGAATNLRGAILAYNHSEEYASSVLLRAKLISTYPKPVIATLTGLVEGQPPVTGKALAWSALLKEAVSGSNATAGANALPGQSASTSASTSSATTEAPKEEPGSSAAVTPAAAASAAAHVAPSAPVLQMVDLTSASNASVVAVQDGRIMQIGESRRLGKFIVLRDVYGDVFTYAGLGSIAPTYTIAKPKGTKSTSNVVKTASTHDPAPTQPASAGAQAPVTLQVKTPAPQNKGSGGGRISIPSTSEDAVPAGMERTRLFAKPDNPDARASAALSAARKARRDSAGQKLPLRRGSVVSSGTVLGKVAVPRGAHAGHLRFAIRPAGDASSIDPGPILANWAQLQKALHPQAAKATNALLGATASDVFLLSKAQLERTVLSDPTITIYACGRQDIASGAIDKRVLALLAFLSRSGLSPTVSALRCGQSQYAASGARSAQYEGDALDITAINGTQVARHQGSGSIADLMIRTLLTLPDEFVPHEIVSLMHYPGNASTRADSAFWSHIHIAFQPAEPASKLAASASANAAHSAGKGKTAPVPTVTTSTLTPTQWSQLITRVGAIPTPKVAFKPTSAAIPDNKPKKK
jgi:membrane-bound lytic murein transglycosylase B